VNQINEELNVLRFFTLEEAQWDIALTISQIHVPIFLLLRYWRFSEADVN